MVKNKNVTLMLLTLSNYYLTYRLFELMGISSVNDLLKSLYIILFILSMVTYFIENHEKLFNIRDQDFKFKIPVYLLSLIVIKTVLSFLIYKENAYIDLNSSFKVFSQVYIAHLIINTKFSEEELNSILFLFLISSSIFSLISIVLFPHLLNSRSVVVSGITFKGGFWNSSVISFLNVGWLSIILIKSNIPKWKRILSLLLVLMSFVGSIGGLSRSFILVMIISIVVFYYYTELSKDQKRIITASIIGISAFLYLFFSKTFSIIFKRFKNIFINADFSSQGRLPIWKNYINNLNHYFIFGNWKESTFLSIQNGQGPHSFFLNWLFDYGIISTFLILYLLFKLWKRINEAKKYKGVLMSSFIMSLIFVAFNETGYKEVGFYIQVALIYHFTNLSKSDHVKENNMKVYLQAYFDNNLGDDLMIKGILNRYPEVTFYTTERGSEIRKTFEDCSNLYFVERNQKFRYILKTDLFLTLGGSVFQFFNRRDVITRLKKIIILIVYRLRRKKVITVGANLGPFNASGSNLITKFELKLNNLITVRDSYSYDYIKKNSKAEVVYADDIVFELVEQVRKNSIENKNILGVSIYRSITNLLINEELVLSYSKLINEYLDKNPNGKVKLFAFDTNRENDLISAKEVFKKIDKKSKVSIISYFGDSDQFLEEFSECDMMIAVRFHSAILADIYDIDYYPIAYSNKMTNYIKDTYSFIPISLQSFIDNPITSINYSRMITQKNTPVKGHLNAVDQYLNNIRFSK